MGVRRYRARRSLKGTLKLTANGHYDYKFKRLKYIGTAKGLHDAANVEFVFNAINKVSSKLNRHLLQQKQELHTYADNALNEYAMKMNKEMSEKRGEMKRFTENYIKQFEIRTSQYVLSEDNKIKIYVDQCIGHIETKIQNLNKHVWRLEHELYPLHQNKTTSALAELKHELHKVMDDIRKSVEEIRIKVDHRNE